jgi:hypothetical protein
MRNYCINTLTAISGPTDEKLRFLEFVRKLDFNNLIPEPDWYITEDHRPMAMLWWRIENWGTKWNVDQEDIMEVDGGITFYTACDPPFPIIAALSLRFPNLEILLEFTERVLGGGRFIMKGGEFLDQYWPPF